MSGKSNPASSLSPRSELRQMYLGYQKSQLVYVAAKLGIADLLKGGPKSTQMLADATNLNPHILQRIMRGFVVYGLVTQDEDGRFGVTPLGECLQTEGESVIISVEEDYPAWGALLHTVQTGDVAFDHVFGMNIFEYYTQNPEAGAWFNRIMDSSGGRAVRAVVAAYDFSTIRRIIDIGGGYGRLMAAIVNANPHMSGVVFDMPFVVEGTREHLQAEGLANCCEVVAGDFFESVPLGGDAYILKWILHDWKDERCVVILRNCRRAMGQRGGKLLVVERVMPERLDPSQNQGVVLSDLAMMIRHGGHERTEAEFRDLFQRADFKLNQMISTESEFSIIEGTPV